MLLTNPVVLSVIVMCVLCLLKVNVLLAIMVSALTAGLSAGISLGETMSILIENMGGQSNTALSYVFLGILAAGISRTGLADILSTKLTRVFKTSGKVFLLVLAGIACCSQNIIFVHIAFIPILIPPLLSMMNSMKLDRRGAACSLTFGLKAPYICIPAGAGLIFQGIIADNMILNGVDVDPSKIWTYLLIPTAGMLVGLLIAIYISYASPRKYADLPVTLSNAAQGTVSDHLTREHVGAILGTVSAFVLQLITGSLPFGAFIGVVIMIVTGAIPFRDMDATINDGVRLLGLIAFVLLVASGYAGIIRATGGVDSIVEASSQIIGDRKVIAAFVLLMIGLLITMGIGTSFGTIPIVAAIYVPLCVQIGFSTAATAMLIGVAGALGDAGSPASDSTLGPTAGLNADGQHNHIWDTCVPTFLHFNIPLLAFGVIAALIL